MSASAWPSPLGSALRGTLHVFAALVLAWEILAIAHFPLLPAPWRWALAGAVAGFSVWGLWLTRRRWPKAAVLALWFACWLAWMSVEPSLARDWRPEVAVMPRIEVNGDRIRITGLRNFEYRSPEDFTPRFETRELRLSQLRSLDFFLSYWRPGPVGHTFVSFNFDDAPPVSISIETRPERGEGFDPLASLFRHFELIYVVGDERDLVRVRSNYRHEDVFLYRTRLSPDAVRRLFLVYAERIDELAEQPEFYHLLSNNCTINIIRYANRIGREGRLDIRHVLNGWSDRYLYRAGVVETALPFDALRARSQINAAAQAAGQAPDFSERIRMGRPVPQQRSSGAASTALPRLIHTAGMPAQAAAGWLNIDGENYRVLHTLADLQAMSNDLGGKYALGRSIDAGSTAKGEGFSPIGTSAAPFTGTFDGRGHAIHGLTVNRPDQDDAGLFGHTRNATLRNVSLIGGSITGRSHVGALAGRHEATRGGVASISNVHASADVSGGGFGGGLVGYHLADGGTSAISHAHAFGKVSNAANAGGLVGLQQALNGGAASMSRVSASGNVWGNFHAGGLVGFNQSDGGTAARISQAFASGNVAHAIFAAGGLVGYNHAGSISDAYAVGNVSGGSGVGGLVGRDVAGSVSRTYATGAVSGSLDVAGGLVGYHEPADSKPGITHSYWNTETTGQPRSAGGQGLATAQMFDAGQWRGFDFGSRWGNAGQRTTPYLRGMAGNRVIHREDLPTGAISARNRPRLHTVMQE